MLDLINSLFTTSVLLFIQAILVSLTCLKLIHISSPNFLRFLYIPSGKSATNARLLGGLAISAALFSGMAFLFYFYPDSIDTKEKATLGFALISISLVTFYGYVDDKYEVRVRYKLSLQLASILIFSFLNAKNISAEHPAFAFFLSTIFGLGFVNGANLLDGLDTLSIKLGSVTSLSYLYLGIIAHSPATVYLSVIHLAAMSMFYFYNREPAKIYMGEIGGSIIGLIFYVQSSLCFSQLKTSMDSIEALSFLLIAGSMPLCELGVSFLRRIWSKKSPFRGDRLHLHYIIKSRYKLSASETSTEMGKVGALILWTGLLIAQSHSPHIALTLILVTIIHFYLSICMDEWRSNSRKEFTQNIFDLFKGKTVYIIDSSQFNSLHISLPEKKKAA